VGTVTDDTDVHTLRHAPGGIDQEHDGRLDPLGFMEVHQPHDVAPPRLERDRVEVLGFQVFFQRGGGIG
jgi:hypothetical protein